MNPKDPLAKAAAEVEEVIAFVRKGVPVFKRIAGAFEELSGLLKDEESRSLPPVESSRILRAVSRCMTCGASGRVGAPGHDVPCPVCLGKGVISP